MLQKYEIPLQVVARRSGQGSGSTQISSTFPLTVARMLFDGMETNELYEQAPITEDELHQTLQSHPDMEVEDYFSRLLDADFTSRFENIDVEREANKIPKNYDVALALAMGGRLDEAADVMDFLKPIGPKQKLDVSNFEQIEKHRELIEELVEERLQQEMEARRDELHEQFKSAFIRADEG